MFPAHNSLQIAVISILSIFTTTRTPTRDYEYKDWRYELTKFNLEEYFHSIYVTKELYCNKFLSLCEMFIQLLK
jgi:hypothetical protein